MNMKEESGRNPALYASALYMFVALGRVHELVPGLQNAPIGKIALGLAILSVILFLRNKPTIPSEGKIVRRTLWLFAFVVFSIAISVWGSNSFKFAQTNLIGIVILCYLLVKTTDDKSVFGFYVTCLIVIGAILGFSTATLEASGRLTVGSTFDPNDLAMMMVTLFPIAVTVLLVSTVRTKIVIGIVISIMLIAIILTGSRGGFLGLLSVSAYLIVAKLPTSKRMAKTRFSLPKLVSILAAVGVLMIAAPESYWDRISTIFNPEDDYNLSSDRGRIAIWTQGLELVMARPYGVGVAAFPAAQGMIMGGAYQTAHNSLIQIAAEIGVIGFLIYMTLYRLAWVELNKVIDEQKERDLRVTAYASGMKGSLIGFFVTSFFLSQAYAPIFYALVILSDRLRVISVRVPKDIPEKTEETGPRYGVRELPK